MIFKGHSRSSKMSNRGLTEHLWLPITVQ